MEKPMTTIKEAMKALPKSRAEYYKTLVGAKVTSIETVVKNQQMTVYMVLTRQCEDGALDHRLVYQVSQEPISWTTEETDDKKRSSG
jgi:ACT domain-containing protein